MESVLQRSTYPVYEREKEVPYEGAGLLGVGGCSYVEKVVKKDGSEGAWVRKVIEVSTGDEAAQLQRIEEEVKAIRESTHPHVVEYVDSYRFLSSFNIIIAPVAECTLEGYLTHTDNFEPILDPNRRVLLEQWPGCLLQAVRYLHDRNIRHTDIKPCNILIHHGNILISDFGISKNSTGLDTTGSYGTPGLRTKKYCAPETFSESGSRRGRAEDIFSLGCVFLEIATVLFGVPLQKLFSFRRNQSQKFVYAEDPQRLLRWIYFLWAKWRSAVETKNMFDSAIAICDLSFFMLEPDPNIRIKIWDLIRLLDSDVYCVLQIKCRANCCHCDRPDQWAGIHFQPCYAEYKSSDECLADLASIENVEDALKLPEIPETWEAAKRKWLTRHRHWEKV
jgi:serine/threonine protein kinase